VCSGSNAGSPDLDNVVCDCAAAFQGDALCGSCTPGKAYGGFPSCQLCPVTAGSCGSQAGRGYCDATVGCICNAAFSQPATGCDGCAANHWGPYCQLCPACGPHGLCNGNGTATGSGECVCKDGYSGVTCSVAPPAAAASTNSGAVAAGVSVGLILAAAGGLFVFVKFGGGGPAVFGAAAAVKNAVLRAGAAVGITSAGPSAAAERVSILRSGPVSSSDAAARFGSIYPSRATP